MEITGRLRLLNDADFKSFFIASNNLVIANHYLNLLPRNILHYSKVLLQSDRATIVQSV